MQQAKDYLKNSLLTENEKRKRWDNIITGRMKWWESEYKRLNNSKSFTAEDKAMISDEIQVATKLEIDGGKCPRCKKDWIEVKFNNVFGSGRYFKPDCHCYFKCTRCKNYLYDMYITTRLKMNRYTCQHCGWVLLFDGEKRFGADYEYFYDNQSIKPKNINIPKAMQKKKEKEKKEKKK